MALWLDFVYVEISSLSWTGQNYGTAVCLPHFTFLFRQVLQLDTTLAYVVTSIESPCADVPFAAPCNAHHAGDCGGNSRRGCPDEYANRLLRSKGINIGVWNRAHGCEMRTRQGQERSAFLLTIDGIGGPARPLLPNRAPVLASASSAN